MDVYVPRFNQSPVEGHLDCFQFGGLTKKIAVSIHIQVFVPT